MKTVNRLRLPVLEIGFVKSENLMPGPSVLLLQDFVVLPCIPGAQARVFALSTQYVWLVIAVTLHRSFNLLMPFDFWKASTSVTKQTLCP